MRGIKPETWTDDKFVELSPLARLLFLGMWNYACDNGHVEDKPTQLKMRILPADDCNVPELLDEMLEVGCVVRSETHLTIPKLPHHQRIDKRYFTSCEHCEPDEKPADSQPLPSVTTTGTRGGHDEHTTSTHSAHALKEGRKEGEGEGERSATGAPRKRATQRPDTFKPSATHRQLAADQGVNLDTEWPKFCDYHAAKGSTFKDWDAALRTWLRNAATFSGNVRPLRGPPPSEAAAPPPIPYAPDDRR